GSDPQPDQVLDPAQSCECRCDPLNKTERTHVPEVDQPSCSLCQKVQSDPVRTSCGHWLCRQCITSYWDQSGSSGDSSCPQCEETSRTRAELQIHSSVQSKTGHLSEHVCTSLNTTCVQLSLTEHHNKEHLNLVSIVTGLGFVIWKLLSI
uniref:RING-type domain-containing protein n=1 Tax=Sphaeramia orbicularis TaxID=375764 RepID=A0A673ADY7_9TELE